MNVIKVNSATKQTLCNNPIEVHNMSRKEAIHRFKKNHIYNGKGITTF